MEALLRGFTAGQRSSGQAGTRHARHGIRFEIGKPDAMTDAFPLGLAVQASTSSLYDLQRSSRPL